MINKIYIIRPVGGGKSTFARRLSEKYGFIYCELDSIVHKPDYSSSSGNRKRTDEEINVLLNSVLSNKKWIAEDTGRKCFENIMKEADSIIQMEPPLWLRKRRILLRWVKQKLKLEKCGYNPTFKMLRLMFKWTRSYESGTDGVKNRLNTYREKVSLIKNENDIIEYINKNLQSKEVIT